MTIRDVYIGELGADGALDWGGDPRTGNIPKRIGPFIVAAGAHERVIQWIEGGRLSGRKVDWGAHAAKVSVQGIAEFLDASFGSGHIPPDLATFIATLDPSRDYALVASEL
jgi:hypothetical protein